MCVDLKPIGSHVGNAKAHATVYGSLRLGFDNNVCICQNDQGSASSILIGSDHGSGDVHVVGHACVSANLKIVRG